MFEHELLLAEIKSIRQDILTPLTNPLSLIDLNNLDETSGTNPALLKHESLSGFYLQVERRLGYIIPAQGESKINSFGRANPFYKGYLNGLLDSRYINIFSIRIFYSMFNGYCKHFYALACGERRKNKRTREI
jgi:hypothetical protein